MPPRVMSLLLSLLLLPASAVFGQSPELIRQYEEHLAAAEADPDDPEKWVYAGMFAGVSLRTQEAIRILESIDPSTIPGFTGQLYWVYLTGFSNMAGEHERELGAAKEYAELFPDGQFRPYLYLRALASLGRVDEVNRVIEALPPDSTDGFNELLGAVSGHFRDHGFAEAADGLRARELAWYEARPLTTDDGADYRLDYAVALYKSDRWRESEELLLQLAEENPEKRYAHGYRGLLAARNGDEQEAATADAWLAGLEVSEGTPGINTLYRARIAAVQGDIERAGTLLKQALAEGYPFLAELRMSLAWEFQPYLDHPAYRDFLRPRE